MRYAQTTVGDSRYKSSRRSRSKIYLRYAQTTVGDSRYKSSRRSRRKIYLRYAQTTVADLGFAVRSVGISLGPGLVAWRRRAESKRRTSRPRRKV